MVRVRCLGYKACSRAGFHPRSSWQRACRRLSEAHLRVCCQHTYRIGPCRQSMLSVYETPQAPGNLGNSHRMLQSIRSVHQRGGGTRLCNRQGNRPGARLLRRAPRCVGCVGATAPRSRWVRNRREAKRKIAVGESGGRKPPRRLSGRGLRTLIRTVVFGSMSEASAEAAGSGGEARHDRIVACWSEAGRAD